MFVLNKKTVESGVCELQVMLINVKYSKYAVSLCITYSRFHYSLLPKAASFSVCYFYRFTELTLRVLKHRVSSAKI